MKMKKLTGMAVGMGLAITAAWALADSTYHATESGYISDNDGRLYTYVIYGADEPATSVVVSEADINTKGRAAAQSGGTPAYDDAAYDDATPAKVTVSVKAPDVNEVFGRA
jgi:hypothetical protein